VPIRADRIAEPVPGPSADPAAEPMRRETVVLLLALCVLLTFLVLEPYGGYAAFGSDTGEYYRLTQDLVATGALPHGAGYAGWGSAYPDFPGIYLLAAASAQAFGIGAFGALTIVVPVVSVLSALPLFLLFRRLYPNDAVALLAAGVSSLAMPRLFSIAHPAPLALGDFFCIAAWWMFVEGRTDRRYYALLIPTAGALILTHHLSSYFFAVGALGGLLFLELWRPRLWSARFPLVEFGFLAAFVTATFVFWFYGTTTFVAKVLLPGFGSSAHVGFAAFEAVALFAIVVAALLVRWRRAGRRSARRWVRLPTDRSVLRDAVWLTVGIFGGVSLLIVLPLPGTSQSTSPAAILWFTPVLALGILCAGSRRALSPARLGPWALMCAGALGLSAGAMLAFAGVGNAVPHWHAALEFSNAIAPERHVEYLFVPIGLLVAVGAARLAVRARERGGRAAFVAVGLAVTLVLAANGAIVYPPQADFGGFEEGLTPGDAAVWMWVGAEIPANTTVATDHRLSSFLFGFDGLRATWVTTPALFTGTNRTAAFAELHASGVPDPAHAAPIVLVVIDAVMYHGVALDPGAGALPLSAAAVGWFAGPGFVPIYENGLEVVYLVDFSTLP
jgi:hypothetical protein